MRSVGLLAAFALSLLQQFPLRAQVEIGEHLTLRADDRMRVEVTDWFSPEPGRNPGRYELVANRLRLTATLTFPRVHFVAQVQDSRIGNLSNRSIVAPLGPLGPGAVYLAHTRDRWQGETVVHQAFAVLRSKRSSLTVGRFEHSDGAETTPGNRTLATLKRVRIAERLIGPFNFTHVGRSFDGARFSFPLRGWTWTLFGARPTHGGFEVSANRSLDRVTLASGSVTYSGTAAQIPLDVRAFYLYFDDRRRDPVKVDNRAAAVRGADEDAIAVHTVGGHALAEIEAGPGTVDGLLWVALQTGDWGRLDHRGWAFAIEGGYQLARVAGQPWLRLGYNASSGDGDPADDRHETFLTPLPTARRYARFPFFNAMNLRDTFAMLVVRPFAGATLRADYHWLQLSQRQDLWYNGGGATNEQIFGIVGLPGGDTDLGHLVDLSLDYRWSKHLGVSGYVGRAFGGSVVRNSFTDHGATYGYVEIRLSI